MDSVQPNFVNILALTRSMLGFYVLLFCQFATELWPLIGTMLSDSTIAGL